MCAAFGSSGSRLWQRGRLLWQLLYAAAVSAAAAAAAAAATVAHEPTVCPMKSADVVGQAALRMRRQDCLVYVPGEPPSAQLSGMLQRREEVIISEPAHAATPLASTLDRPYECSAGSESQQVAPCTELALCTAIDA